MLPSNNEFEIKRIIEENGKDGWLRTEECATKFAKDPTTQKYNHSRRTKFYRIRKQIEKGKVEGLKVLLLAGNISYIGLSSADPKVIGDYVSEDKKASRNVKTSLKFYEWWERRADRKKLERKEEAEQIDLELLIISARRRKRQMINELNLKDWENLSIDKEREIDASCRREYGLPPNTPL